MVKWHQPKVVIILWEPKTWSYVADMARINVLESQIIFGQVEGVVTGQHNGYEPVAIEERERHNIHTYHGFTLLVVTLPPPPLFVFIFSFLCLVLLADKHCVSKHTSWCFSLKRPRPHLIYFFFNLPYYTSYINTGAKQMLHVLHVFKGRNRFSLSK